MSLTLGCTPLPEQEYSGTKIWKEKVDKYDLKKYAPKDYENALKKYQEAEKKYGKDNKKSLQFFNEALAAFKNIYDSAFPVLIKKNIKDFELSLTAAKKLKVQITFKKNYESAVKLYEMSKSDLAKKAYEDSLYAITSAKELLDADIAKLKTKKK